MPDPRLSPRILLPLLVLLAAIGPMVLNLPLPAVPGLARYFATDPGTIQLIITLYLAGMAISQLFLGPLSDRFGRRPVMLACLAATALTSVFAALAASATWLIVARVLQSVGASAGQVIGRAIIRDVFDRDRAASMIGWVTMAMVVAPMLSPSIGGLLNETVGWRWIFVVIAVIAAATLAISVFALPETRAVASSPSMAQLMRDAGFLMRDRVFLAYLGIGALSSVTFFAFVGGAPHVVVTVMGESSSTYGLWFIANAGGYMIGNALSGRFAARVGSYRMIYLGTMLMVFATLVQGTIALSGWMTHPATMFLPQAVIAFSNGLQLPSAIAGGVSVRPEAAGSASGIIGFVQMGVGAIAAQISGTLVGIWLSPVPMVAIILIGGLGAWGALTLLREND